MHTALPSQVVAILERAFPFLTEAASDGNPHGAIDRTYTAIVATIIELIDSVPPHLLANNDVARASDFWLALNAVRTARERWPTEPGHAIKKIPGGPEGHPLKIIRDYLVGCPDTRPSPAVQHLPFLRDPELDESVRGDVSATEHALIGADFKVSTVFAAAASEALLLWACSQRALDTQAALENMSMGQLIDTANRGGLLSPDTVDIATKARDFRNLIHPGRARRLAATCSRATALVAIAAFERVRDDLARQFP